jgi:5-methylthioadenosine/S-adenosylhomocysteine deaminase
MSLILIKNPTVLTMEPGAREALEQDILVEGALIKEIRPGISDANLADVQVLDGTGTIALPGLINAHIHVWQSGLRGLAGDWTFKDYFLGMLHRASGTLRAEDVYLANRVGAAEQISFGITTVLDWSHALHDSAYADAAIAGLSESGIRAVFGYGTPGNDVAKWFHASKIGHPQDARRAAKILADHERLTLALAIRGPDFSSDKVTAEDIAFARELRVIASMHVGADSSKNGTKGGISRMIKQKLLGPDINFVHANNITDDELRAVVAEGASITVTPEVEMQMGMGFPVTSRLLAAGGAPTLGTDIASATSADLFSQMRITLQVHRAFDHLASIEACGVSSPAIMEASEVLTFATRYSANALGLSHKVGTLTPGKRADLILVRPGSTANPTPVLDPYEAIVLQSFPTNVETVLVDGEILKRNSELTRSPSQNAIHALSQRGREIARLIAS